MTNNQYTKTRIAICDLTPEQRLLLLLSRLEVGPEAAAAAKDILSGSSERLDYDKLFRVSARNGVAALLYRNLRNFVPLPEEYAARNENFYFHTCSKNVLHLRESLRVLSLLEDSRIEVVPLKGSVAGELVFEDIGLYPTSDIDLLVRHEDLDRVEAVLESAGYRQTKDISREDIFDASYHINYANGTYTVEVHWNLVMRYFDADPGFWWQDAEKTEFEGIMVSRLAPERYILYAIFRLFSHAFVPLRFSLFVSALIHAYRDRIDWQKLEAYAGTLKMKRLAAFSLRLMHDLHGSKIDPALLRREIPGYGLLLKYIMSGVFSESKKGPRMLAFILLLDSPLEFLRVLSARVFPTMGEIRWRYDLSRDSKKAYLYYLLNPFILLARRR